ncbi:glycine-rich domain-containing protein [Streptomyces sp. NPDC002446]
MSPTDTARLLPWQRPDGNPCFLVGDGVGFVSRLADEMEVVQLNLAGELIEEARRVLDARTWTPGEIHLLAVELTASLVNVRRVAESRGARLSGLGEDGSDMDDAVEHDGRPEEHVQASDPRDLVSPAAFASITHTVLANNPGMGRAIAERIVVEAIKFEAACARRPRLRLKPSRVVDEGWHALILHTRVKAELARKLGLFVHHVPEPPGPERHDPGALARTQKAIRAAGYVPDPDLWTGPSDGTIAVAATCEHSEPPPAGCGADCSNTGPN